MKTRFDIGESVLVMGSVESILETDWGWGPIYYVNIPDYWVIGVNESILVRTKDLKEKTDEKSI